jgi:ADP-ribose pyrophosphatase YjhB (NUDIX family)
METGIDYIGVTTPFYCNDGKGNFLLHKRSKKCRNEIGRWDPGSGKLEFGLTGEENVLKEVGEEYECKGTIQEQVPAHSILRTHNGLKTHWLAVPSFILVDPKKVKNNDPEKIDEIGWFTLDTLPEPLHTGFYYTFTHYKSCFKKYKRK